MHKRKPKRPNSKQHKQPARDVINAKKEERTTKVVLAIVSFLVITLAVGTVYNILTREMPPTTAIQALTVDTGGLLNGIIIRDETAYIADFSGQVTFAVEDNSRVRQDTLVATISNAQVTTALQEEINELETHIMQLQMLRTSISPSISYVNIINDQIRENTNNNIPRMGNLAHARTFAEEINNQVSERNSVLLTSTSEALAPYVLQTMQNARTISSSQNNVRASSGGIVSFVVDGMEHLNPRNMHLITEHANLLAPTHYQNGVFKIVNSNTWHIAAFLENEVALNLQQNTTVPLFIKESSQVLNTENDEKELEYPVYSIEQALATTFRQISATVSTIEQRGSYSFAIFTIQDFMQDYIGKRNISFKLADGQFTGLSIPIEAMATRTLLKIPAAYIHSSEDDYYVTTINAYGEPVQHVVRPIVPRNQTVTEGYMYILQDFSDISIGTAIVGEHGNSHMISSVVSDEGVFRVNTGLATFTSIDTTNMIETQTHFVLDAQLNRGGITQHDRIVSDAVNYLVYEGQLVH